MGASLKRLQRLRWLIWPPSSHVKLADQRGSCCSVEAIQRRREDWEQPIKRHKHQPKELKATKKARKFSPLAAGNLAGCIIILVASARRVVVTRWRRGRRCDLDGWKSVGCERRPHSFSFMRDELQPLVLWSSINTATCCFICHQLNFN